MDRTGVANDNIAAFDQIAFILHTVDAVSGYDQQDLEDKAVLMHTVDVIRGRGVIDIQQLW